jgi:hypothetical protein
MRKKCEECGDYKFVNDDDICTDCKQDRIDMEDEDWLPEDDMEDEDEDR